MFRKLVIGIDEAGRGPLAGPLCVGLVMMEKKDQKLLVGIKDSKKLSEKKREEWFKKIKKLKKMAKLDFVYSMIGADVIDKKGIIKAINIAIYRDIKKIGIQLVKGSTFNKLEILLDGALKAPRQFRNQKTIIKGDEKIPIISAASVVAKVMRDRRMVALAKKYPEYGFERHKGYGTREHNQNIKKYGQISEHRKSFIKVCVKG